MEEKKGKQIVVEKYLNPKIVFHHSFGTIYPKQFNRKSKEITESAGFLYFPQLFLGMPTNSRSDFVFYESSSRELPSHNSLFQLNLKVEVTQHNTQLCTGLENSFGSL